MAGRKPKPTAVKKLEGNPGKRKLNVKKPVPAKGIPACPDGLNTEADRLQLNVSRVLQEALADKVEQMR